MEAVGGLLPSGLSAAFALAVLAKATLILGAAWAVVAAARRTSAAVRHGVWVAALLTVTALPLGTPWLPHVEVELPTLLRALPARPSAPGSAVSGPMKSGVTVTASPGTAALTGRPGTLAGSPRLPRSSEPASADWELILLAAWTAGLIGRALWLAIQLRRVRRIVAAGSPIGGRRAVVGREAAAELRVRRPVTLLECEDVTTPVTCGVRRPVILLPAASRGWAEERLRVVLLHELAHIRRRDYLCSLLAELAAAIYWPVPLVWVARAAVQAEQEHASDDLVLASGTSPLEYADHLLAIARTLRPGAGGLVATLGMAREIGLKRRIRTILDRRTRRAPLASLHGTLALGALGFLALPLAALSPAAAASSPLIPSSAPAETPEQQRAATRTPAAPAYLWAEAEDAVLMGDATPGDDLDASEGHYVWLDQGGEARISFQLPRTATGIVWARVRPRGDARLTAALAGGDWLSWTDSPSEADGSDWRWVSLPLPPAPDGEGGTPSTRAGATAHDAADPTREVALRLASRDGTVRVDRVLLTTDPAFVPRDRGARPAGFTPVYRWIEVAPGPLPDATEFTVDLPVPGRYVLWGRVMGPDDGANSLFLSIDGEAPVVWDAPSRELRSEEGRWLWDPASARELAGRGVNPLVLELSAGSHVLKLAPRERGTGVAGLLLTNDLTFRPRGRTPASPAVQLWLEAESARPASALRVREGGGASGEGYLQAATRGPDRSDPDDAAAAELRFDLPSAGIFTLWGRALARRDSEDSFWIRVNGERWVRWNGIPRGDDWQWSTVHDGDAADDYPLQVALPAGENRIEIARREGGARLDRLLLTTEEHLDPRSLGTE